MQNEATTLEARNAAASPAQPPLLYGGDCDVPPNIATCPECGETLHAECQEWVTETGRPTVGGLYVYCNSDAFSLRHKCLLYDWQPVNDAVAKWCGAETV